jgi:dTDP-4-amino-4,6-dideoxygalactose transaminase/intein/homing endonuclease
VTAAKTYPLFKAHVPADEALANIRAVFESGFLNEGTQVTELTLALREVLGAERLVLTNSCTSALTLALKLAGVTFTSDVVSTALTCVASNTPIVNLGARIVWADVNPLTGMLDTVDVAKKITPETKAVIAVAWAGTPPELAQLQLVCRTRHVKLILDAAHAFGAEYNGRPIHEFSDICCYSFQAIKHFTSVTPETPVLIRVNQVVSIAKIGDLDNKIVGSECLAFDQEGKTRWSKITAFIRHPIDDVILAVKTEKGRTVKITRSHSVFTYDGNKFIPTIGAELKIGDFLAVPRRLDLGENKNKEIDLLELLKDETLMVRNDEIRLAREGRGSNAGKWVKRWLPVDERLCKILGYYAAEGGVAKFSRNGKGPGTSSIRFSFGAHERNTHVKDVISLMESLFPYRGQIYNANPQKTSLLIIYGSTLVAKIFKALGCGDSLYTKGIPSLMWNVPDSCKWAFVDGLMNGDGHTRSQDGYTTYETLKVASSNLANGLHYLLLSMGVQSSVSSGYTKKNDSIHRNYECVLINRGGQHRSRENTVPRELTTGNSRKQRVMTSRLKSGDAHCNANLLNDIALLRITDIQEEPYKGDVYDFSVDGLENFIGGYGAICLHNTGDGGAIVCKSENDYKRAKALKWFGLDRDAAKDAQGNWKGQQWDADIVEAGYKFNMNNIAAVIGLSQIPHISRILWVHRTNAELYDELFADVEEIRPAARPDGGRTSAWVYTMLLRGGKRDELLRRLNAEGIMAGLVHVPNDNYTAFAASKTDLPGLRAFAAAQFSLPCGWWMTAHDVRYVAGRVKALVKELP